MMTLLSGHSLTGITQFEPESMQLNLSERQSTATITVGDEAPEIVVGDWIRDDTEPGQGIVWRVKTVDTQYERHTRTIQLEHMINTLRDRLMFGEVTPKTITGNQSATNCTAEEAITYILNQQSDWVLNECSYSVSNPYNFNSEDLFSALENVSSSLEDCWWSFDYSVYPFEISITPKSEAVSTELRMERNIQTAKLTIDRSRMYTRLYPIGKNNIHIDGDYVSLNEDVYGIICKTETDQSIETKAELLRWASERIRKHCEPSVTATVALLDLSKETGESLDHIVLGAMCRMPLPGYNTTITETITKISYQDKIAEPERATVTLANIQEDVASIINQLIKSGGAGSKTHAKNGEEDHAWMIDTNDHIGLIAEGVAGEGAAQDWSRVAELLVDGNGIHQRVTQAQADIVDAYSLIDQTTTAIRIEIGTVASEVRSFIETTPDMIHAEVGYAASGLAHSVIEQTATYIRSEVENAASAISSSIIEQTTEYVRTEVASVASGVAWSVITQTMTNIEQQIARKSKVYVQWTDPNDGVNVLYEGDIWIKRQANKTWNEANAAHERWNQTGVSWRSKYGDLQYVWKNGTWVLVKDYAADVENEVKIEQTATSLAVVGKAVDTNKNEFNSKLEVTARQIRTEVNTASSNVYSVIEQTAINIRSQVANVEAGLQSQIEQTASSITTSVSAAKSTLYSVIQQTATGIYTNVTDYVSGNYSTILQTSTSIAMAVKSAKDNLQSSIDIEKNRISLVVEGTGANAKIKPAEIVASINNGASNIIISADHINLNGYVKATDITANLISSKISLISTITAQAIEADSVKIRPVSGMGLVNVATAYNGSSLTRSGNTYTLRLAKMNGNYDEYSFSRAVASVDWSLSNGTLKVTPQPQNQEFTLGSLTDYRIFSHSAQTVPSGFVHSTNGYYIAGSGTSATVRIYSGADMTIGGKVIYSTSCNKDDYLETVPTYVYRDGYNTGYNGGYDANHNMFIGDANVTAKPGVVNVEVGIPVEVWAYFKQKDNNYQWSSKYTFTAVDPYPNSIAVTKAMTGVDQSELPVYYGKLYALIQGSYQAITSNNYYWYYSSTNISSRTLHY